MINLVMIVVTALFCVAFVLGIILLILNWLFNGGGENDD